LSFNKVATVPKYGKQASKLLALFAFLNPDGILIDFLNCGSSGLSFELREIVDDKLVFHEAIGLLHKFSLIGRAKGAITVHRMVQAVLKDNLPEPELKSYVSEAVELCDSAWPEGWDMRERCRVLQSQVVEPAFGAANLVPSVRAAVTILRIAHFLYQDGKLKDSERLNVRGYEILQELLGEEHPDTLTSTNNLAATYSDQGKLEDAAELEERVLELQRRILGEEHPDTLMSMGSLGLFYHSQGRMTEASSLMRQSVDGSRKVLGDEHPDTVRRKNMLHSWINSSSEESE